MKKRRLFYLLITVFIIIIGLLSRKFGAQLPMFIALYAGDTLWAAMVYFGIKFLFPYIPVHKAAFMALLFSYGIEISQLYQANWINALRNTTLGGLVLGHGFLWTDILCYTVGIIFSVLSDWLVNCNKRFNLH